MSELEKRAAARRAVVSGQDTLEKRAAARKSLITEKDNLEKRAAARQQVLAKLSKPSTLEERAKARRAYFQGGPGPNDPTQLGYPSELKYPRMEVPVGGDSRQWEQNWFEQAAEVSKQKHGPSGVELELKKKLQRASTALRGLEAKAQENPAQAKAVAKRIATDLNEIVNTMDSAGYLEDAEEADGVLEDLVGFIDSPDEPEEETEEGCCKKCQEKEVEEMPVKASARAELVRIANILDSKGYMEEASEIDSILSEL